MDKVYIAIDLKSFYASVECADRNLNPLTTNLVVADESRTEKTICLAVTPSLKAHGISGRARLFEVIQAVKDVNNKRFNTALRLGALPKDENGRYHFASTSFDAEALSSDPSLELSYIVAPPRMKLYEEISTKIFSIYMRYISAEDIHVYSIDECFIDATSYLGTYRMTPHELAMTMIREVLYETGITATAGIGTNMYLAKVAMDIVAKHVPSDKDGVRIAELNEQTYRELLWCHTPLTDFWQIGSGVAKRVAALGCRTMGDIARLSTQNEDVLYDTLGIKAGGPLCEENLNVFFITGIEVKDESAFQKLLEELPDMIFTHLHVKPDIIVINPAPLPHEKSKFEKIQEDLAMIAYREAQKKLEKQIFGSDSDTDDDFSDTPQLTVSPKQLNIVMGRRNEGATYPA